MPVELVPYISAENYNYLMGLTGVVAGFLVWMLWSKGI